MKDRDFLFEKIGLEHSTELTHEGVQDAYDRRLAIYQNDVNVAGSKAERRVAKATLKEFESLHPQVMALLVVMRVEERLNQMRAALEAKQFHRAETAWRQASDLSEDVGQDNDFDFILQDAWAELQDARAAAGISPAPVRHEEEHKVAGAEEPVAPDTEPEVELNGEPEVAPETEDTASPDPGSPPEAEFVEQSGDAQDIQNDPAPVAENIEPLAPPVLKIITKRSEPQNIEQPTPLNVHPADCMTLLGPEGERLHILSHESVTFGRSKDCHLLVRAHAPHDEMLHTQVSRLISRLHMTITRHNDDICIEDGGWSEGTRRPTANGIFTQAGKVDSVKVSQAHISFIRFLKSTDAENPPCWAITPIMTLPDGLPPKPNHQASGSGPHGLFLKREDGSSEDVLLLWGSVAMHDLDLANQPLWISRENNGYIFSTGKAWLPLELGFRLSADWQVVTYGSLMRQS